MGLTTTQKLGWGLADLGLITFVMIKQLFILFFLTNFLNVPVFLAGWTTTSILLFDLLTDPLIGAASDRTRGRFGRRAPWMVFGAIAMSIATLFMFNVPEGLSEVGNLLWFNIAFAIATVGHTMINVTYNAMGGEIAQSGEDWAAIRGFRVGFATVGLLMGGVILPFIAANTLTGFSIASYVVAPIMLLAVLGSVFLTSGAQSVFQPIKVDDPAMFQHVYNNYAFITLATVLGLMALAVAILMAGAPFIAIFLMTSDGSAPMSGMADAMGMLAFLLLAIVIGSILSQPVWATLSKRVGALTTLIISLVVFIAIQLVWYVNSPNSNALIAFCIFVAHGFGTTAYRQVPWLIYPDLIKATQRRTGLQIEGVFQIAWMFGQRLGYAIAPVVLAAMLGLSEWTTSSGGAMPEQSAASIEALRVAVTLLPAGILAIALVALVALYIPLSRRELSVLREAEA